jgi:hypothetical protein
MVNIKNILLVRKIQYLYDGIRIFVMGENNWVKKIYYKMIGKKLDLQNPKTLNEKISWLKLNYMEDFYVECCDKYLLHNYLIKKLGRDYAPKLLFASKDIGEFDLDKIESFPCIMKTSNGSGSNLIIWNKEQYTNKYLRHYFKREVILSNRHAMTSCEHQYLKSNPFIIVEELLQDKNGGIPNDYKFVCINGRLEFIYCSVDRLGTNVRHVYDKEWNRLHFIWVANADKDKFDRYDSSPSIEKPRHYSEMIGMAEKIAKDFPMVRVDFYETDQNVYIGEITLHHGSGCDSFYPDCFDLTYGQKLELPKANRKHRR